MVSCYHIVPLQNVGLKIRLGGSMTPWISDFSVPSIPSRTNAWTLVHSLISLVFPLYCDISWSVML